MSTREVADKQSMRDWYLLGPDDMETVRIRGQDVVKPKAEMTVYEDDWSKYEVQDVHKSFESETKFGEKYLPAWWAANLDLRRSLDYMHHWGLGMNDKLGQHDSGIDPGLALMHSGAMHDMTDTGGHNWTPWPGKKDTYKLDEHWGGTHENSTNQYLLTTLLRQSIVKLQKSQFMAAHDAKYERSGPQVHVEGGQGEPGNWLQPGSEPWRNYVDFAKDLPGAQSSDELLDQLRDIDAYKDRSLAQKSYLGNKAIVRYLMDVIADRGGTDDLTKFLTENTDKTELQHTVNSTKIPEYDYLVQGAWAPVLVRLAARAQPVPQIHDAVVEQGRDVCARVRDAQEQQAGRPGARPADDDAERAASGPDLVGAQHGRRGATAR